MRQDRSVLRWLGTWSDRGHVFRIGRAGDELVAEWDDGAKLRAAADGGWSEFSCSPQMRPAAAEKLREGVVAALVRHIQGRHSLHASAVSYRGGALVCLGDSGEGKSTAAALSCNRPGVSLLADDVLFLENAADDGIRAVPTERLVWIDRAAASQVRPGEDAGARTSSPGGKLAFPPVALATAPVPLRALVKLSFDDSLAAPRLSRVSGSASFGFLSVALIRFILDDEQAQVRDFAFLSRLSRRCPTFELARPNQLDRAAETVDCLLAAAEDRA